MARRKRGPLGDRLAATRVVGPQRWVRDGVLGCLRRRRERGEARRRDRAIGALARRRGEQHGGSEENFSTGCDHPATLANVSGTVHYATLRAARVLATDVVEYVFALAPEDRDLRWRPGQFVSLTCGEHLEGEPVLRSYTIASSPGEETLAVVLKLVAGGAASEWFRRLRVGAEVRFTGPMGFFVLELAHAGDVVMGATGTGIAPFLPMLHEMHARTDAGRIHLLWGLREEGDLFWQAELASLVTAFGGRLEATVTLSRPSPRWSGPRGRITGRLLELAPALHRPTFYLCGNGAMIREVKAALVERGIDRKRQIRTEAFFD
jgi:ferredoxin-NADP reductase